MVRDVRDRVLAGPSALRYRRCVRKLLLFVLLIRCSDVPRRAIVAGAPVARDAVAVDTETVAGAHHYLRGYPSRHAGAVLAVIEIPAGTTAKVEVDEDDGWMHWQHDRDGSGLREIDYLPFPVSYGMVPRTLGGDGDALDIVVLGRGLERGRIVGTRVIGVLQMGEPGERDDKLVAVPVEAELENGFSRLHDLAELDAGYPACRDILELWFANYWGPGVTHVLGWGDAAEAERVLTEAERAFSQETRLGAAAPRLRARRPAGARDFVRHRYR